MISLVIIGTPLSKKNGWGIAGKRVITSPEWRAYEASSVLQLKNQWRKPPITHPVRVTAHFYRDNRCDTDNLLTGTLDLLQKAGVLKNDGLARRVEGEKHSDGTRPRCEIEIEIEAMA